MPPEKWNEAFHILEDHGIQFFCVIGNELLAHPDPVGFVKAMQDFHGKYAIYTTFPPGLTRRYLDECIEAGLYNVSAGIDVFPGLLTGDRHVDRKSSAALHWLTYCKEKGVPDVHAAVTIHRHNYMHLEKLFDLCTELGLWIGVSMVCASADGGHDFYYATDQMQDWLIPPEEKQRFHDEMHRLAGIIKTGRWMVHETSNYFEGLADRELAGQTWHCSLPLIINVEEDLTLRACNYRGPLNERFTVFDLKPGGRLTMQRYVELQQEVTSACPGCSSGGGAWSYWIESELHLQGDIEMGDKHWQTHLPGHEFEKTVKA